MTITFDGDIDNGKIQVPEDVQRKFAGKSRVHVTVRLADRNDHEENFLEHLIAHPVRVEGFTPLAREEIYDRKQH